MKVSELSGQQLDYWVARANNDQPAAEVAMGFCKLYSTRWDCGGPIIEREGIGTRLIPGVWLAFDKEGKMQQGTTLLEAAMRCFVASRYGDEVQE